MSDREYRIEERMRDNPDPLIHPSDHIYVVTHHGEAVARFDTWAEALGYVQMRDRERNPRVGPAEAARRAVDEWDACNRPPEAA